jgi:hypothetical protein
MNTPLNLTPLVERLRELVDEIEIIGDDEFSQLTDHEAHKFIRYYRCRAEDYLEAAELLEVYLRGALYNYRMARREEAHAS